jgi:RNA polymerase sigma-70 factor, ECF subfamily
MKDVLPQDETILKSLIIQAKNGDPYAFEKMYKEYYTPLFRYIYTRIKNKQDAEDITQTVFIKIWNALPSFNDSHTSPLSFFFTVARNTLIDFFRKSSHKEIVSDEIIINHKDIDQSTDKENTNNELREILSNTIKELSEEQQEIITLIYTNDFTYSEVASITGKREDAIRQIHSRAIKKLRTLYTY